MDLTDPLLVGRSTPVSSDTLDKFDILCAGLLEAGAMVPGPKLDPRPLAMLGGGDATRVTGPSRLIARR